MRTTRVLRGSVFAILLTFLLLPAVAHAAGCTVKVGTTSYPTITQAAAAQTGPSIITVTGTCTENVILNNARSITIDGSGGAIIVGPLDMNAFDISLSRDITLMNLEIHGDPSSQFGGGVVITEASDVHILGCNIHHNKDAGVSADTGSILFLNGTTIHDNTPNDGLDLFDNSTAEVINTTIESNGDSLASGVGVFVTGSSTVIFRQTNLVQNNADSGIQAVNLSVVRFQTPFPDRFTTVRGHKTNGIFVAKQSHLQINGPAPHLIQGNGTSCPLDPTCGGIFANADSTVHLSAGVITGNHGSGISVQQGSNVRLNGATVSSNTGDGVHIQWLSIGDFLPGNTITGNGRASVFCDERSLAIGNLKAFSKVRCEQEEIEQPNEHGHGEEDKDRHR